jgi:CDP-paratose 2-epimerase
MRVLITGGAGFIGTNLSCYFARQGDEVVVYDNLSRSGVKENAHWLRERYPNVRFVPADIRDPRALAEACQGVDRIYHLAAQVAVTTSVLDPRTDYEVNLGGTLNLLEAARHHAPQALVFFTSTNKVYGGMEGLGVVEDGEGYRYADLPDGIGEQHPLDFHSPYGCSKGGADQYVRDYSRIYGLKTVVFRMSCIYGPHQCGNEDQGWVAHFARAACEGNSLTIYGDGRQVRDILFVDDLVRAFVLAGEQIERTAGQVFNIGGGAANTVSLLQLIELLRRLTGSPVLVTHADWRPGDQRIYVSNTRRAREEFGWEPRIGVNEGVGRMYDWILEQKRTGYGVHTAGNGRRRFRGIEPGATVEGVAPWLEGAGA